MSGFFFVHAFFGFQEKRVLRTCGGLLVITHYEPETMFQEQARNKYNNVLLEQQFVLVCNIIMW